MEKKKIEKLVKHKIYWVKTKNIKNMGKPRIKGSLILNFDRFSKTDVGHFKWFIETQNICIFS